MEASIGEPFALSSHAKSQRLPKLAEGYPRVYATYTPGGSDGYVTAAVQGDGVHVYELSSLHSVFSHTLGPTSSFAAPAVTRIVQDDGERVFVTSVPPLASSDLTPEQAKTTLWTWKDTEKLSERAAQKQKAISIPYTPHSLHTCSELPENILLCSSNGDAALLGSDHSVIGSLRSTTSTAVIRSFVFPRSHCTFIPSSVTAGAVIVQASHLDGEVAVRILTVNESGTFTELGDAQTTFGATLSDISCSSTGCMSVIDEDGVWKSFDLDATEDSLTLLPSHETIHLDNLHFKTLSLLSLGTSLVLLSAISPKNSSIVLLMWDLQYSVVLSHHTLPIPDIKADSTSLTLVSASDRQVLLLFCPSHPAKSTVYVVPCTAPAVSTIANAMGRSSSALPWIKVSHLPKADLTEPESQMLVSIKRAADGPKKSQLFFDWVKADASASPSLGYVVVKEVLNVSLDSSAPALDIVKYLLERRVVSDHMVEVGLLTALRNVNDWTSIEQAMTTVSDLREAEIIDCLRYSVQHTESSMDVDGPVPPPLPRFLSLCIRYSSLAPANVRLAVRKYLSDPDDVCRILEILDSWLNAWTVKESSLLPHPKMLGKNQFGVVDVINTEYVDVTSLPPLDKIVSFLQMILDTSFVSLIQHAPAHKLLHTIHSRLEPQVSAISQGALLRGPLEPYAKAQAKAIREARDKVEGVKPKQLQGDWRQRKKQIREQANLAVAVYQVEELVL